MKKLLNSLKLLSLSTTLVVGSVWAHGNVTPQKVDITGLEPLIGEEWIAENPYYGNPVAVKIGMMAYGQNCAMCHGLGGVSGGIAPDLRKTFTDTASNSTAEDGKFSNPEGDELFQSRVRNGVVRNGAVYMPKMAERISQEGLWTIWAFISTLCDSDMVDADKKAAEADKQCAVVTDNKLLVKRSLAKFYE